MFAPAPPETKQDRTLGVFNTVMVGEHTIMTGNAGYGFLSQYVKTLSDVEMVSIYGSGGTVSAYRDGSEIKLTVKRTDGEFWKILDFPFVEGGPITIDDETSANDVCVINEATREKYFGGAPALGKFIEFDGRQYRVCGVVRNIPRYRDIPFADVWVPVSTTPDADYRERLTGSFNGLILARDEGDFDRIKQELKGRLRDVPLPSSAYDRFESAAETMFEATAREMIGAAIQQRTRRWRLDDRIVRRAGRGRPGDRDPALHAPADHQPRQPQRQQDDRALLGNRRQEIVRRVVGRRWWDSSWSRTSS